jgi:hypothetical protein
MEAMQSFGNSSDCLLNNPEGLKLQQRLCENLRPCSIQRIKEGDINNIGSDCKDKNSRNDGNAE